MDSGSDFDGDNENGKKKKKGGKTTKKSKNNMIFDVKRPIIFVCNDLYTKALRPLRDMGL